MAHSFSIVIPAYNEADNVEAVIRESHETLRSLPDDLASRPGEFEIILIDDCSRDNTYETAYALCREIPQLRVIKNSVNIGCHPSSLVGFKAAKGEFRLFIPADRQIPAAELVPFVRKALEGHDVVYSWRVNRADNAWRRLVSGFYNALLRSTFGITLHDVDSASLLTQKAVERILPNIQANSAFITVEILIEAKRQGLSVGEVEISHRPRVAGVATGLNFKDISKVPLHFFRMAWWLFRQKWSGRGEPNP